MAKPVGKANLLHQQILAALLINDKRGLAKNVSLRNIDIVATRWSR